MSRMASLMWIYWLFLLPINTGVFLPHTCRSPPVELGEVPKADVISRAPSSPNPNISYSRLQHTTNLHCQYFLQRRDRAKFFWSHHFKYHHWAELQHKTATKNLRQKVVVVICTLDLILSSPFKTAEEGCTVKTELTALSYFIMKARKKKSWLVIVVLANSTQAKATTKISITNFILTLLSRQSKLFKQGLYWISEPVNVLWCEAVLTNVIRMKQ